MSTNTIDDTESMQKILTLHWEKWLRREFNPFMLSLFKEGASKKHLEAITGDKNLRWNAWYYQNHYWYSSEEVCEDFKQSAKNIAPQFIFKLSEQLSRFHIESKEAIVQLINQKTPLEQKLQGIYAILTKCTTFIWITHALEHIYTEKAKEIVSRYTDDIDFFISKASIPEKKNKHAEMETAILNGISPEKIAEDYGWIRDRTGFSEPFSADDIKKLNVSKLEDKHESVSIPEELKPFFKELKELVWFRTARTDVFYELIYKARPIIAEAGLHYGISFNNLKYYTIQSLINGKPLRYNEEFSAGFYEEHFFITNELLLNERKTEEATLVKGNTAFMGKVNGHAKIVYDVSEISKVKQGDILITQMTFPSFIEAMYRASAFVTDEGGITCHAAIVAREMGKPCIVGTKIATKVFKDGDLVEVDAVKGIVRKIKK